MSTAREQFVSECRHCQHGCIFTAFEVDFKLESAVRRVNRVDPVHGVTVINCDGKEQVTVGCESQIIEAKKILILERKAGDLGEFDEVILAEQRIVLEVGAEERVGRGVTHLLTHEENVEDR